MANPRDQIFLRPHSTSIEVQVLQVIDNSDVDLNCSNPSGESPVYSAEAKEKLAECEEFVFPDKSTYCLPPGVRLLSLPVAVEWRN